MWCFLKFQIKFTHEITYFATNLIINSGYKRKYEKIKRHLEYFQKSYFPHTKYNHDHMFRNILVVADRST